MFYRELKKLPDSIEHLFINCEYSATLWTEVESLINSIGFLNYKIDHEIKILDDRKATHFIINLILLSSKQGVKKGYCHSTCKKNIEKIYGDRKILGANK